MARTWVSAFPLHLVTDDTTRAFLAPTPEGTISRIYERNGEIEIGTFENKHLVAKVSGLKNLIHGIQVCELQALNQDLELGRLEAGKYSGRQDLPRRSQIQYFPMILTVLEI